MLYNVWDISSCSSVSKESTCNVGDLSLIPGSGSSSCRRDRLPTPVFWGFPGGSDSIEPTCNVGDLSLILGLERSPGEGKCYPLQSSGLENSMEYSPWDHKETDRTERLSHNVSIFGDEVFKYLS